MVKDGLKHYGSSPKLHMLHAQLLQTIIPLPIAQTREALSTGTKKCSKAVPLWIMASRLEEKVGVRIKARALLEKARSINPKSEEIWLESVKVEERDQSGAAKGMLARCKALLFLQRASHLIISLAVRQLCKHSPHQDCCTLTLFGPNLDRLARLVPSTLSRRPTIHLQFSRLSLDCSGENVKSRKREVGSNVQSTKIREIRIMATRGLGGGSLRSNMVLR